MPFSLLDAFYNFHRLYTIPTIKHVENWFDIFLVYSGFSDSKLIKFKNGKTIRITRKNTSEPVSNARAMELSEEYKKTNVKKKGEKFFFKVNGIKLKARSESLVPIYNEFNDKPHSETHVKGRDVLDVGAYLAETSLYYILIGKANHVYALEPFPYICKQAEKTVSDNGLKKKISVINAAVAGKNGTIQIDTKHTNFGKVDNSSKVKSGKKIHLYSLDSITKKLGIKKGALKIDTEGAEYATIGNASSETLSKYDQIHVEYHHGYKSIKERLEKEGFKVDYTKPIYMFKGFASKAMIFGDLYAWR